MLSCTMHEMYQFASICSLMLQCWELQSTTVIDWREEKEIHQHDCAVNDVKKKEIHHSSFKIHL